MLTRSFTALAPLALALVTAVSLCACGSTTVTYAASPSRVIAPSLAQKLQKRDAFVDRTLTMYGSVVQELARGRRTGSYYAAGQWYAPSACWRCHAEIGTAVALVSRLTGLAVDRDEAAATFDRVITDHQQPDGSFGLPDGDLISTAAELVSMGTAYEVLGSTIAPATRSRWRTSLTRAADWLMPRIHFYVNGNVNLQEVLGLYLAWRVTGQPAIRSAYNEAWGFTRDPGPHWPGFGLHLDPPSASQDGQAQAGYLAEEGAGAPGFDPHYTILQADYAGELFAISRQARFQRLLNLLVNKLLTRANHRTLYIKSGVGSRHPEPNVIGQLVTCGLPVLAFLGGRSDLIHLSFVQLHGAETNFHNFAISNTDQDQVIGNYAMALLIAPKSQLAP